MRLRILPAALLALALASCDAVDSVKEGWAHSQAVSTSLEKTFGLKPFVGFNWLNGNLESVSVNFDGIPANVALADIMDKSRQAIAAEFKQTPHEVVVSFTLKN
jgi:hypothetical protein